MGVAALLWGDAASLAANPSPAHEELRPNARRLGTKDVSRIAHLPHKRARIVADGDIPKPERGETLVVPATSRSPGALGVVTSVGKGRNGRIVIETADAPLAQAYSEIRVPIRGKTLDELDPTAAATGSASSPWELKCHGSTGTQLPHVNFDMGSLKPRARIDLQNREIEIYLVLAGKPAIIVEALSSGEALCEYEGPPTFSFPITGTPLAITVAPEVTAVLSGTFDALFSWRPRIKVGVDKRPGEKVRVIHRLTRGNPVPPSPDGSGHLDLLLGARVGVSIAGAIGVGGSVGPLIKADLSGDGTSACSWATASVHVSLATEVNTFFKRWKFPIADENIGELPLWNSCPS